MSYHKLSNLREIFQGDLNQNLWMESYLITSWIDLATATVHQKLIGNVPTMESAEKCVWYTQATCKICDDSYIVQTQQKLKD